MLKSESGFSSLIVIFVLAVLAATFSSFIINKSAAIKQTGNSVEPAQSAIPQTSPQSSMQLSPSDIDVSQSSPSASPSPLKFKVNRSRGGGDDEENED